MNKQSRRKFIATTSLIGAGLTAAAQTETGKKMTNKVIHHVFFWLKNPGSKDDLNKLIEGLRTLEKIETVRKIHIGIPAATEQRSVVDATFSASELLFFDDLAGQKTYQTHPVHLKFVENCSHLWEKVIVYDVVDA